MKHYFFLLVVCSCVLSMPTVSARQGMQQEKREAMAIRIMDTLQKSDPAMAQEVMHLLETKTEEELNAQLSQYFAHNSTSNAVSQPTGNTKNRRRGMSRKQMKKMVKKEVKKETKRYLRELQASPTSPLNSNRVPAHIRFKWKQKVAALLSVK